MPFIPPTYIKWKKGGKWGLTDFTWGDYQLVEEVAEGLSGGGGARYPIKI